MREIRWDKVLDDLPTECSRKHEAVEMISYDRSGGKESGFSIKVFCPSCHQKLKILGRKISGGRYAATGYEIIDGGDIT